MILEVKDLCKTYDDGKISTNILRNVTFSLDEGEFVSIMGPSGSGKSTLLYAVSGMDRPTAGKVILNGNEITGLNENEMSAIRLNEMGFVFQQMNMLRNLSIYDNIILPAYQSKKQSKEEINDYAQKLIHKMQISHIANHDISKVSGGQLQRACIARALINKPKIVFADEPTGALNSSSTQEVMDEFIRINNEGISILVVTHDVRVAAKSDRILYIVDGNIKGEIKLGKFDGNTIEREKRVSNWLFDMGF